MDRTKAMEDPRVRKVVEGLQRDGGTRLHSVVLYGSAARDEHQASSDWNLIVVLGELTPEALESVAPAIGRWTRAGQPMPRFFSPALIAESSDVFPVEYLELKRNRIILHGEDPFAGVAVRRDYLRLQCERELREKMMRLREGYVQTGGKPTEVERLLKGSYGTFVALFRGCLDLLGADVPAADEEVVAAFCARAELDPAPFADVRRLKMGEKPEVETRELFSRYYQQLTRAVQRVDRFESGGPES